MNGKYSKCVIEGNLTLPNHRARQQVLKAHTENNVELDFSYVRYMDSTGIQALKGLQETIQSRSGDLRFTGVRFTVSEILRVLEPDLFSKTIEAV